MNITKLTADESNALKSTHGRVLTFQTPQGKVYMKLPSLADISLVRGSKDEDIRRANISSVARRACVHPDDPTKLFRDKPGLPYGLGTKLLQASGMQGAVRVLEEAEIEDPAMAAAFAQHEGPKTHAVEFVCGSMKFLAVLVEPNEAQLSEYFANSHDAEVMGALLKRLCKFGDIESLEDTLPGAYVTLAEFLIDKAGLSLDFVVGEA